MLIAVISDTHMPKKAKHLPKQLTKELSTVDLIIHAGDWQTLDIYKGLSTFAPVEGVVGNVDEVEVQNHLHNRIVLDFAKVHIGITHGHGKKKTTEKRALDAFEAEDIDIIIFGHSHIPVLKQVGDIILFNPGSPTEKRRQSRFSYGLIQITENNTTIKHVFYEDKS